MKNFIIAASEKGLIMVEKKTERDQLSKEIKKIISETKNSFTGLWMANSSRMKRVMRKKPERLLNHTAPASRIFPTGVLLVVIMWLGTAFYDSVHKLIVVE